MIRPGSVESNPPADHYAPRWYDFLFGGKPAASKALNPVKAAIGVFTPEVDAVESAIQPLSPDPALPEGWYDARANASQNQQNIEGTGSRKVDLLIPVTSAGQVQGFFPADVDYNSVTLSPRFVDDVGNITESSSSARIAIKVNTQDSDWIVLSYNIDPRGIEKNDWTSYTGSIRRIWIQVVSPTQDAVNEPYIVLSFLKGASMGQGGTVAGGSSSPSQSTSQGSEGAIAIAGSGGSPTSSGGGGSPSGGSLSSGGGGTGGVGGGSSSRLL